jgi:MscS family membrane protein
MMRLRFDTFFRSLLIVLACLTIWAFWAGAQTATNTSPEPAAAAVTPSVINEPSAASAWLTFGLDRVKPLQRRLVDIPLWQYLASLIYVFLAFYVSKLLDYGIGRYLLRWAARTATRVDDLLLNLLHGPVKVVAFVILLHIGLRVFAWPDWLEDFMRKALVVIVAVSLTYLALRVVDVLLGVWRERGPLAGDEQFNKQFLPILRKTFKVFIIIVAVLLTANNLGLNITSLIASLGIGGLAVALAAQDTLANLFGGVAVLLDKPFKVGDRITVDNVDGTVETIGFRSTRVRNLDGHLVAIPNKTVANATVVNIAQRPNIRTLINIGITYDTPAEKVQRALELLREVYGSHPMTHDVWISFNKFADFSLNLFVIHWWKTTDFKAYLAGMQEMNLAIKQRFDAERISFAFPTQTLHVKQDSEWRLAGSDGPPRPI